MPESPRRSRLAAGTPEASGADRRWLLVALAVGVPVVALVIALAQRNWYPTGDLAQAELRMRSLPSHPPLIGAAGRIVDAQGRQGNHPGPLMFWATWPLYALLGRSSWAFEAATAIVNLVWLSISVWLVQRRAGIGVAAWYGVTALVVVGGYGLNALTQPWNPWVALLPFTVVILAAWAALDGARWAPILAVAGASYAIQGHVGYAPVALPLVAIAVGAPVWRWWHDRRSTPTDPADGPPPEPVAPRASALWWVLPIGLAALVGVVAWSGPALDVVRHDPSNVQKLLANFGTPSEPPIGLRRAVEAVLQSASPWGAWVRGGEEVAGSWIPGALFLAAWAAVAVVVGRRRTEPGLTRLNVVLAVATLFGVFAVSRIFGALYLYVFRWIVVIIALQVFALGWGLAALLPRPSPATRRRLAGVAVVALVGLSAFTTQRVVRQQIPYDQSWRMERVLARQVRPQLDPSKRYLITWDDPAYLGGLGFGLLLDLDRRGYQVGAEPRFSAAVEPQRVRCPGTYDAVLTTVSGRAKLAEWDAKPGATRIASVDLRASSGGYDRSMRRLQAALRADGRTLTTEQVEQQMNLLVLDPGQPPAVAAAASSLVLGGVPSAVYLQDPAPPTPPADPADPLAEPCTR